MNRAAKEWITVAAWGSLHTLVAVCLLVNASGTSQVINDETLSLGTLKTQPVSTEETAKQHPVQRSESSQRDAKREKPKTDRQPNEFGIFPNEVESDPRPISNLQPTEVAEIATKYASVCSKNNVQLMFVLGSIPIHKIGNRYLVQALGGKQYVFDDRGPVSGEGVRFGASISLERLPSTVAQYLNNHLNHYERQRAMVVLSDHTEVAMHRSLRAFLQFKGSKTLVANTKYSARMSLAPNGSLLFDWSAHPFQRIDTNPQSTWRN